MKRKILLGIVSCILMIMTLCACSIPGFPPDPGSEEVGEKENLIFNAKSELYLIYSDEVSEDTVTEILTAIDGKKAAGYFVKGAAVDSEAHDHEIVIGDTGREISKTALMRLDRIEQNTEDDLRYLVYSDGSSIAIVSDFDYDKIAEKAALEAFLALLTGDELVAVQGVVAQGTVNLFDYFAEKDTATKQKYYTNLAEAVGGEVGINLAGAMKQFYSLYTSDMIIWLANLYEPSICVCNGLYGETECKNTQYCGTGAFYYSNSARDTIGYLPDVESTYQALGFLNSSGVTKQDESSWKKMLDDEILDDILAFVRAIQREDGYFVHPQWQSPGTSRISRDLNWSTSLLKTLGASPYYTTPTGVQGIGAPSASSALSGHLTGSTATACSSVVAANQSYLPHLESIETFKAYLVSLNVRTNSYSAGNTLSAQSSQIRARDKALGLTDPNSLYQTMIDFLNENQNPDNGTWDWKKPGDDGYDLYYQVNGLMKVSGVYGSSKPLQYVDQAVATAVSAITYDKDIGAAVDIYNPWFALTNIFINLNGCGGEEGKAKVAELRQMLYESAPETLIATRDKISKCKKADGSFSYSPKYSSATSQGAPAAVPNSVEGDVNGTVLSCSGLIDYVYSALGLSDPKTKVPLFGLTERYMFLKEIREIKHLNKPNTNVSVELEDFESYYPDDIPENDSRFSKSLKSDGVIKIVRREDGQGNAVLIDSNKADTGDSVTIKNQSVNPSATTFVFEADFCLNSSSTNYPVQITMGEAYMFSFRIIHGEVAIYESSSATQSNSVDRDLGVRVPLSEWFGIKVEYYYGTHNDVRIKFYFDEDLSDSEGKKLIAITDNYYDKNGNKIKNVTGSPSKKYDSTQIYVLSDAEVSMLIDNAASYKLTEGYIADPALNIKFNVDAAGKDPVKYGFEDGEIPSDMTASDSGFLVLGAEGERRLTVSSPEETATLNVPVNAVSANGKCLNISMNILCTAATAGDVVMNIVASEELGNIIGFALVAKSDSNGTYLTVCEYNDALGAEIPGTVIPLNKSTDLKIKYYGDYRVAIVYIDGEFIGASTELCKSGNRRCPATDVDFSFTGGKDYNVSIDDLMVERNSDSYLDAVKPDIDSVIHDFEDPSAKLDGQNSSITTNGGTLVAKLDSRSATAGIRLPVLNRSKISSAIVAELELLYQTVLSDGKAHDIAVTDADGKVIFGVSLVINDDTVELYEMHRSGTPMLLLATLKKSETLKLSFEVFVDDRVAFIYAGGSCVGKTESFAFPENVDCEAAYLTVNSTGAKTVLFVDNVKAETLYAVYENKEATMLPNAETEGTITFEKSNSNSLPSRLYRYQGTVRVENVPHSLSGDYSNSLVFHTKAGINEKIGIQTDGGEDLSGYSCVTFETDFKIDVNSKNGDLFWFYFSKNIENDSEIAYQLRFNYSGGKLKLIDRSAKKGFIEKSVTTDISDLNEWHRLKIEYYAGDKDTARIRIFIDDELIYVSDNYYGRTNSSDSPVARTGIKKVFFYSFSDTDADMYLDNMSLYGSDATCDDTLGAK